MRRTNLPEVPSPRLLLLAWPLTHHPASSTLTTAAPDTHYLDHLLNHLSSVLTQTMIILTLIAITIRLLLRTYHTFPRAPAPQDTSLLQATQLLHSALTMKLRINLSQATLQVHRINLFLQIPQALLTNRARLTIPSLPLIHRARLQMTMTVPIPLTSTLSMFNAPRT